MLIRNGLPSRVAAMTAIRDTRPAFVTVAEMNQWLASNQIAALTDQPAWPTPGTASVWKKFRADTLVGGTVKWEAQDWRLNGPIPALVDPNLPGRIEIDDNNGAVSVTTPDYRHVTGIRHRLRQYAPSLMQVSFAADRQTTQIFRIGRGAATWQDPNA